MDLGAGGRAWAAFPERPGDWGQVLPSWSHTQTALQGFVLEYTVTQEQVGASQCSLKPWPCPLEVIFLGDRLSKIPGQQNPRGHRGRGR